MISKIVFLLCGLTSMLCAILLLRSYSRRAVRLLLWSGICFVCFSLSNFLLMVDRFVVPSRDLAHWHTGLSLAGVALLIYGLIWDS